MKSATPQPLIGTAYWYDCIDVKQRAAAKSLVARRVPVVIEHKNNLDRPMWTVLFEGTNFWADGFDVRDDAQAFAQAWNARIGHQEI